MASTATLKGAASLIGSRSNHPFTSKNSRDLMSSQRQTTSDEDAHTQLIKSLPSFKTGSNSARRGMSHDMMRYPKGTRKQHIGSAGGNNGASSLAGQEPERNISSAAGG